MQANYTNDPLLFERCLNLLDEAFPGCKEFALQGIKYKASWSKAPTPFVIEDKDEIIAHAGVWPLTFMLNGKEHRTASIHGICVKNEHRGKGYFKQLMHEAMQFTQKNFDSSILFTDKPYLYKNFPYKVMLPEYDFIFKGEKINTKNSDLRILRLDDANDLNLIYTVLLNHLPLSNEVGIVNGNSLFILNTLKKDINYSKKLNALIIYEIVNNTLYIKDILSTKQLPPFREIIELIPNHLDKIVLQFCPDKLLNEEEYTPILAKPECCIMVSEGFLFNGKYFRYPDTYYC